MQPEQPIHGAYADADATPLLLRLAVHPVAAASLTTFRWHSCLCVCEREREEKV